MTSEFANPAGDLFLQMVRRRDMQKGREAHSLVYHFAESRADSHAGELRNLESVYLRRNVLDFNSVPADYREQARPHLTQILLGSTVMAIEDTLARGSYSHYAYTSRIRDYLSGTVWAGGVSVGDNVDTHINPDKMETMYIAARGDLTLAIFIEVPKLLPEEMQGFLERLNVYDFVKRAAADFYKEALELVNQA